MRSKKWKRITSGKNDGEKGRRGKLDGENSKRQLEGKKAS